MGLVQLLVLLGVATTAGGQALNGAFEMPKVIPPSPVAAGFAKYGELPVSTYTGTVNVSIPLYTVQHGDITVPVSLDYHTGGIRLNEQAGWTGLGWVLQCGGVISRTVRGRDDLNNNHHFNTRPELVTRSGFDFMKMIDPMYQVYTITDKGGSTFNFGAVDLNVTDFEYDLFTYNLPGRSGKFIMNKSRKAVLEKNEDVKVELSTAATPLFTITDENGLVYYFERTETTTRNPEGGNFITAWYLSRIASPTGKTVTFDYVQTTLPVGRGVTEVQSIGFGTDDFKSLTTDASYPDAKILKRITFNNHRVEFLIDNARSDYRGSRITGLQVYRAGEAAPLKEYIFGYDHFNRTAGDFDQTADGSQFKRLKLTAVYEKAGAASLPPHQFFYHEDTDKYPLTSINSRSIDYWGYFNGASQGTYSLLPPYNGYITYSATREPGAALLTPYRDLPGATRTTHPEYTKLFALNEVRYPTGGRTTLALEAHEYNSQLVNPSLELKDAELPVAVTQRGEMTGTLDFSKAHGNITMVVSFRCSAADECATVKQRNYPEGSIYFEVNTNGSPTRVDMKWQADELTCGSGTGVCSSKTYTFAATDFRQPTYKGVIANAVGTDFQDIRVMFRYKVPVGTSTPNADEIAYAGGLRVREMVDYDEAGRVVKSKKYDYRYQMDRNNDGVMENYSYGKRISPLQYFRNHFEFACKCNDTIANSIPNWYGGHAFVRYSSNLLSTNTSLGTPVGYSQVAEYVFDKSTGATLGKTVYQYDNDLDFPGVYNLSVAVTGQSNYFVENNRLPGIPSEENRSNGVLRRKAEYVQAGSDYKLVAETLHDYDYPLVNRYYSFTYQVFPPNGLTNMQMYQTLRQERHQLRQTVSIRYDQDLSGNQIRTVTRYGYGDKHELPLSTLHTDSDGNQVVTKTTYPPDYGAVPAASSGIKFLQDKHIFARPVEQYTLSQQPDKPNFSVVSGTLTKYYDDKPYPKEVHLLETAAPVPEAQFQPSNKMAGTFAPDARYRPRLHYDQYDGEGNLLTFRKQDDVPTCYLWGYNSAYPLAEIRNATYAEVVAVLGQTVIDELNAPNPGTDEQVRLKLQPLRTHANLRKALVATYTYKPLVGVTSQTDPAGRTTHFDYDELSRLKIVRDQAGKIVKSYYYHYRR